MKIPAAQYTLESFLEYIVNNLDYVFEKRQERKWLKAHLVYVIKDWRKIFNELKSEDYGQITHIVFSQIPDGEKSHSTSTDFYVYQWEPGLILMFTSSTQESYEKTLKQFILSKPGITESWIKPSVFEDMKNFLLQKYEAKIYRFISKRHRHSKLPAKIRPNYDRRHSYSGEDADETLKEMHELYGVLPLSIDIRIDGSKIQINRNGLFVIRHINRKTIGILQEVIENIIAEQVRIRDTSEKFNVQTKKINVGTEEIKIRRIIAGKITLPNTVLSALMISRMFNQYETYEVGESEKDDDDTEKDFSFIDTSVQEGPLIFTATVVDEIKGTVFGISGGDNEIALIPKHRVTFESFVNFYNLIIDNFDDTAKLTTFSEEILV